MAYVPKEWECGEVVTAEALNHIEQGILAADACCGESMLVLTQTGSREATAEECPNGGTVYTYNHTGQEVYDALAAGKLVVLGYVDTQNQQINFLYPQYINASTTGLTININEPDEVTLTSDSPDDYLYAIECNDFS